MNDAVLEISGLRVDFAGQTAVDGIDLTVRPGEVLGVIGESGSGKSTAALSALGLLPPGTDTSGTVLLRGTEVTTLSEAGLRALRGNEVGMVFQDPMSSLNPMLSIGRHFDEALRAHGWGSAAKRRNRALELLDLVGIPEPAQRVRDRPHEFSGGMRQRVMIALALANEPSVLIADEPTTALDTTVGAQILDLIGRAATELNTAVLLITHDLGVVARSCQRVAVMRAGRIVEHGETRSVLRNPGHSYTKSLLAAVPRLDSPRQVTSEPDADAAPLLEISGLGKHFRFRTGLRRVERTALEGIDLTVAPGETVGIVGGSGSGKSTLARAVAGVHSPSQGHIRFRGEELTSRRSLRQKRLIQLVFQDPFASLHPRMRIGTALDEALLAGGTRDREARRERIAELLGQVGLDASSADRRAHEFSGGQRQRIGIARALATEPELLVCDEPVSSLDVSVQAQVLELLAELRERLGLAMLFIAHDLAVVRQVSHRIAVMRAGSIVELGPAEEVCARPRHPYTAELLAAVPSPDPDWRR